MPRKTRKDLVGDTEDKERAERERQLAELECEIHKEQATAAKESRDPQTPMDEHDENS